MPLLRKVMAAHPHVNAVCTGAILSDYQRTRVESVAIRLGLVPLSYLWQFPFLPPHVETSLLDDMASVGQDARIIKVASGGLDDSFLWENVADHRIQRRLNRAMERFGVAGGGAALGEGGEFETLAIDGPAPLWKGRIEVESEDRRVVIGEGGTASLQISRARVVPREDGSTDDSLVGQHLRCFLCNPVKILTLRQVVREPPMLDESFDILLANVGSQPPLEDIEELEIPSTPLTFPEWQYLETARVRTVSNAVGKGRTAMEQMDGIMDRLQNDMKISSDAIVFTTILLRSMSDFAAVNASYGSRFRAPNPPARVTVACGDLLPPDALISLSVTALSEDVVQTKRGLHVQSRSYWAPANIGPYSQAVSVPIPSGDGERTRRVVYVAGQIPLIPASMELPAARTFTSPETHFRMQAVLSLQHLWRIGRVMKIQHWLGAVALLSAESGTTNNSRMQTAIGAWKLAHAQQSDEGSDVEEDNEVDLWDLTHRGALPRGRLSGNGVLQHASALTQDMLPPCFVAEVDALPRNAPIEWASSGLAGYHGSDISNQGKNLAFLRNPRLDADRLSSHQRHNTNTRQGSDLEGVKCEVVVAKPVSESSDSVVRVAWVALQESRALDTIPSLLALPDAEPSMFTYTVYTTIQLPAEWITAKKAQLIPCRRIWDASGKAFRVLLEIRDH